MTTTYSQLTYRQVYLQQSDPEIRIHYVEAKPSSAQKGTILLIHGFPESPYQYHHVLGPLSSAGYHAKAPDFGNAGHRTREAAYEVIPQSVGQDRWRSRRSISDFKIYCMWRRGRRGRGLMCIARLRRARWIINVGWRRRGRWRFE